MGRRAGGLWAGLWWTGVGSMARAVLSAGPLILVAACAGQPLQPWHTETLTAEYTAAKAGTITDFEAYMALEDRLFAELEAKVYAGVETGPAFALVRYSKGSAADPQGRDPNWNRSFEWPAGPAAGGVLLLHGLTDSPYSLRALGETLHRMGYWVMGLRLPGHGTAPSGLRRVTWEDMAGAVQLAAGHLAERLEGKPLHIIGYSSGAALAVNFAIDAVEGRAAPAPASLVLISPAIGIHPAAALAVWKRRLSLVPGLGGLAWLQVEQEFDPYKYNSFPTNGGEQAHRLTRAVAGRLERLAATDRVAAFPPTLVFKSNVDATVSTEAVVSRLLNRLPPLRNELVLVDVNRFAAKSSLMVYQAGALSTRVMGNDSLPFGVTLVTNENPDSLAVVARRQAPFSATVSRTTPLNLAWPPAVISLSHVALPIPPDDPLYGQRPPDNADVLFLGQMAIQGERGLFVLSADWLVRLRHNPFYGYLESLVQAWLQQPGRLAGADSLTAGE